MNMVLKLKMVVTMNRNNIHRQRDKFKLKVFITNSYMLRKLRNHSKGINNEWD
jgi:hypothetical protein